jgi:hypothetical protein
MVSRPLLLVVFALVVIACAAAPELPQDQHAVDAPSAQPFRTVSTAAANSSVEVTPPPASTSAAPSSQPVATVEATDVCEDLVKLCHDVGHDGGVTGKCHQVGHARDEEACKSEFSACKTACEAAAAKAAKPGAKKHAH